MYTRRVGAVFAFVVCVAAVTPGIASSEPPLTRDGPVPPAARYPTSVAEAQASAPNGSCASSPSRSGCPKVDRVVLVTDNDPGEFGTLAEESWSGYTPLAGAAAEGPIPPGYGCAHFEKRPYKATYPASGNQVARTFTDHKCRAGFAYVETNLCIQRYGNPRAGDWGNLNCDTDTAVGGVQFRTEIQYDCNHPNSVWAYRNSSILYAVRNGTGFLDTGYAYANISYCG